MHSSGRDQGSGLIRTSEIISILNYLGGDDEDFDRVEFIEKSYRESIKK